MSKATAGMSGGMDSSVMARRIYKGIAGAGLPLILKPCLLLVFCLLLPRFGNCAVPYVSASGYSISPCLGKFSAGDNPAWAAPEYDDSKWTDIVIPGSWQSQDLESEHYMGWYRLRFRVPESAGFAQPAIYLGAIGDSDETFLNGVKIGGEGVIGEQLVEAPKVRRLYRIPDKLLRQNEENILSVRVMNTYIRGGIWENAVILGSYNDLLLLKREAEAESRNVEIIFLTFFVVFMFLYLFLFLGGMKEREYNLFGLLMVSFFIIYLLSSLIFYERGLKTHAAEKALLMFSSILPANLLVFLIAVCKTRFSFFLKMLVASFVVITAGFAVFSDLRAYILLTDAWSAAVFISVCAALYILIKAYVRRVHETGYILLGVGGLFTGALIEALQLTGVVSFGDFYGDSPSLICVPFMILCVMYALSARFVRLTENTKALSGRILTAHEEERKRLSRDLHDGVGQSLLSIKLRLQMMAAKSAGGERFEGEPFAKLIGSVSASIEEVRNAAMDIRPSFLEDTDIADAIQWYGLRFQEKTGISVSIDAGGGTKDVQPKVKDNLYRICQEALGNVCKHSGADRVEVALRQAGAVLSLEVKDNGRGFEPHGLKSREKGLGLETMKERAELMGGRFEVRSAQARGTTVYVEVPVR